MPTVVVILSVVLAYGIAVVLSVDSWLSLVYGFPIIGMFFAYLAARRAPGGPLVAAVAIVGFGVLFAVSVAGSVALTALHRFQFVETVTGQGRIDLALLSRGGGMSVHPNVAAMMLLPTLGLALGIFFSGRRRWRIAALGAVGIIGLGIVATGSRGGIVGAGAATALAMFGAGRLQGRDGARARRLMVFGGAIVGFAGLMWVLVAHPSFLYRGFGRGEIWQAVVRLVRERPLFGWGQGALAMVLPSHFGDPTGFSSYSWHAHNTYLEAIGELGFLGAGVIAAGVGVAWYLSRRSRTPDRPEFDMVRIGAFAGLLGLSIHGLFDAAQLYPSVLVIAGFTAGVMTLTRQPEVSETAVSAVFRSFAVMLAIGVTAVAVALVRIPTAATDARALAAQGDWASASEALLAVDSSLPPNSAIPALLAVSTAMAGDPDEARRFSEEAIRRQPLDWTRWVVAAQLAAQRGDDVQESGFVAEAYASGAATSPEGLMALLPMTDRESRQWFDSAVILVQEYPGVLATGYWDRLGVRPSQSTEIVSEVARRGGACSMVIALHSAGSVQAAVGQDLLARCRSDIDSGVVDETTGVAALFYGALDRGDSVRAQDLVASLQGSDDSALVRRLRGQAALEVGREGQAITELAAAAALGDLTSVNTLLTGTSLNQQALEAVIQQGWNIVAGMRPVSVGSRWRTPATVNHWWGLATYVPPFATGPLLPGIWTEAIPAPAQEFMDVARSQLRCPTDKS